MAASLVKEEFNNFLLTNIPEVSLSQLDEIALDYIVSVLEQLGEDESFDVEEFLEVITAYIPDFEEVSRERICNWMFELAGKMAQTQKESSLKSSSIISEVMPASQKEKCKKLDEQSPATDNLKQDGCFYINKDTDSCTSSDTRRNLKDVRDCCVFDPSFAMKVAALSEMFPNACSMEVKRCLLVTNGDAEETARLMLLKRTEQDGCDGNDVHLVDSRPKTHRPSAKRQECALDDQKNAMVSRYGFVDVEADERSYRPTTPKQAPNKLVRYRDNQVVSTRGERFSQIKRDETDEMKKTYVNLKPARKYRFH